jgi:N-glycosylase/DNA lyase
MPKAPADSDRLDRIRQACSTVEELHDQTQILYESISKATRARRAALKPHKTARTVIRNVPPPKKR